MQITTGTRIYYHGDMANLDGFGTVSAVQASRWGTTVVVALDDGRKLNPSLVMFSPVYSGNGSTPFVTEAAYRAWRTERMAAFTRQPA